MGSQLPKNVRVLLAGESWVTRSLHIKGFDSFEMSSYHEGGSELIEALRSGDIEVTYQPSHIAADHFPSAMEELSTFDVVILSDIGSNTLLLPHQTAVGSRPTPNRLELLRDFVRHGGGLLMVGGYLTFQGIGGKANYHGSPVESVLPVEFFSHDDRNELPQGVEPVIIDPDHPVVSGLPEWPHFLGYNRSVLVPDGHLVASIAGDPFIAVRHTDHGRTAIFASDCGPHWGPPAFLSWAGYQPLWRNLVRWLAARD